MMRPRVIPVLLLRSGRLVKTVRFDETTYVGDPRNAVKIFNDKMVDELVLLDIDATTSDRPPDFNLIEEIVSEAFMPVAYGGGIRTLEEAAQIVALGVEKAILSSNAIQDPSLIQRLANHLGSQGVVVCLDVKKGRRGYEVRTHSGKRRTGIDPVAFASQAAALGAGEILINHIDRDGMMNGYDLELIRSVSNSIQVPLIACGGAGSLADIRAVIREGGASAAAAGSLFLFRGRHRSVLITYPGELQLEEAIR